MGPLKIERQDRCESDVNSRFDRSRDPLAELARLIAQANSYPETTGAHESYNTARSATAATVPVNGLWPGEEPQDQHLSERYAPPASGESHQSYEPQERGYEKDPPAARYFSGQARQFSGFSAAADAHENNEPPPPPPGHQLQGYAAASEPGHGYETDEAAHSEDAYATDEYDEAPQPRRRAGLVAVAAILSLTAVCTGGAFGYSAIFGGSVLPTFPPITKARNGSIPVAPAYGDTQEGSGVGQTLAAASSSGPLSAPATASHGPVASAADFQWPAPPPMPAPQSSAAAAAPALTSPPAQVSEPKKIHTVTVRADQTGNPGAAPGSTMAATPPAPRSQSHAETTPRTSASLGQNGPLSLVPGGQGDAPAQRARTTERPMTAASNNTGVLAAPSPAAGGGYAVQVTSESSEAGAQSAFRALQVKYPNQLGGRTPIIRRADLGAKGIYYRAMIGPFGSADQAAELCSNLKAVGGHCFVQKN